MNIGWICRTAWRDSRGSRKRLLLAALTITCGLTSLVAISSFGANVREAVQTQAKMLLGADLVLSSRQPFETETEAQIAAIGGEQSREVRCNSMVYFPKTAGTRLVQVRALAGAFPYYGALETDPFTAGHTFMNGPNALVDDSLLYQFDAQIGDTVKIGAFAFTIVGRLQKIPGEVGAASLIGPRVYIPFAYLSQTALIQQGSMATYRVYFKLPKATDPDQLVETLRPHLNAHRLEADTVQKRTASVRQMMENLTRFLNLTGFVALLLGGLGVASAMQVYLTEKRATVAVLRCLGARLPQVFAVYLLQAAVLGLGSAALGALLGVGLQQALPILLRDFLPVRIETTLAWGALGESLMVGLSFTLLFTLLPILAVRHISPLQVLRLSSDTQPLTRRDPLQWLVSALIVVGTAAFTLRHTERWTYGVGFCIAASGALVLLAGAANSLMSLAPRHVAPTWPYVWRQGCANLHRPHNQTLMLTLALGLGVFLLMTLQFTQDALVQQVSRRSNANQPNLILFDIQSDQREAVTRLLHSLALPALQEAPLVTMRLAAIKGRSVEALRNEPHQTIPDWALQHEYRATYRDHLIDTETLIAGVWHDVHEDGDSAPAISLEEEVARALGVTLGDALVFDIQGVPFSVTVNSIRKVDWQQIKPNFFVVFPVGVLEAAPQTYLLVTKAPSSAVSAAVQRAVVQQFSNVSALDLTSVLHTLDTILGRITFALRFMALFSIAAGALVLANAIAASQQQRRRESVLLRTLGASRAQIRQILLVEYWLIGSIAALSGVLLAVLAGWALSRWLFETIFAPSVTPILLALLAVSGLTMLMGMLGNRRVVNRSPLEVLQSEG
jgi:putative ABC transport system permease protein